MANPGQSDNSPKVHTEQLRIPDPGKLDTAGPVAFVDDAFVVLTQAFCHNGHPLIVEGNPKFSGYPGLHVTVAAGGKKGDVVLSPIHGHHARTGDLDLAEGTRCHVGCPTCGEELREYAPCPCGKGSLRSIFLTDPVDDAHVAAVCDVWGCQRSRVVDEWEILSEFVMTETAE